MDDVPAQMVLLRMKMEKVLKSFKIYSEDDDDQEPKPPKPLEYPIIAEPKEKKKLDFVLAFSVYGSGEKAELREIRRDTFLRNLQNLGLHTMEVFCTFDQHVIFVQILGQAGLLKKYARIYGVNLMCNNPNYSAQRRGPWNVFASKMHTITPDDPLFARAPKTLSGERPDDITDAERIMVVHKILRMTRYGDLPGEYGIYSLINKGVFSDAYPLNDELCNWTEDGPLSDRQLLLKYWASARKIFKEQPINLVQKYFGAEVAFYFAFLGHYTYMLIPASIAGLFCFFYGIITIASPANRRSYEICNSNLTICPACELFTVCKYKQLSNSCTTANLTYLLDNRVTIFFAALMSIRATIFMELWMRRQAVLAYRWNVMSVETDTSIRPEYEIRARYKRLSTITDEWEPWVPPRTKYCNMFVSYVSILFLILLAICIVLGVMLYYNLIMVSLTLSRKKFLSENATIIAAITSSSISVVFMLLFERIYIFIAELLTRLENPRTQIQYDNSYTYKRFVLCFVNGYSVAFYIAFFKGRFYTYPGDPLRHHETNIRNDLCDPAGCSFNLFTHLVIVLGVKSVLLNALQVLFPLFVKWVRVVWRKQKQKGIHIWEKQYELMQLDKYFLVSEYQEVALQYGFTIFFSAAFPLAPVLALIHAVTSIRVDSFKLVKGYRRPIPVSVPGLQAWIGIFKAITHMGVIINAFVIAFTTDFIPREIYNSQDNPKEGFIHSILSVFDPNDYKDHGNITHPDQCYYRGMRHPYDHNQKYRLTIDYWFELTIKFAFVVVFEHILLAITGIVAYCIPDTPKSIREKITAQRVSLIKENLALKKLDADDDL